MNLFVVGWSAARPVEAPAGLLPGVPFFPGRPVRTWTAPGGRAAAAWVAHTDEYEEAGDERLVLWSGHPEGRFARVSYDRRSGRFDLEADPMGSYPLYSAERDGVTWLSNNPTLIRGSDELRPEVIASLVGGGWSLTGDPLWADVRRVDRGPDPAEVVRLIGRGLDVDAAADDLKDVTARLGEWPGRPNVVPVTAGRDSRLVLAAALQAGLDFTTITGGNPGEPDVDVGRRLAQIAGVPHELIADDAHGALHSHWHKAAELLALTAGGTATLADAVGFPFGPRPGPLPLWHSGQGGEIARGYYAGTSGDADSIYRAFVMRRPHRHELLNEHGERIVREQIGEWLRTLEGADRADVPDLFYLLQRMGKWAGPTHGAVEYVRDTTSPLWHRRMLPHLLALPAAERAREEFHLRVLDRLAPQLAYAPGWPKRQTELQREAARATSLARKVRAELARRARARRTTPSPANGPADPFAPIHADIRELVLSQPDHPAWQVIDRSRAEAVLTRDTAALDEVSRYHVWRLATVFAARPKSG